MFMFLKHAHLWVNINSLPNSTTWTGSEKLYFFTLVGTKLSDFAERQICGINSMQKFLFSISERIDT